LIAALAVSECLGTRPAREPFRILVGAEEGHPVRSELTLTANARGRFVDDDVPAEPGRKTPPAWLVIGGLLLASVIPALWFRRRGKR
jgi:hypothetical protein